MHHATHIKMPSSHERNGLQQSRQREDPVCVGGERELKNAYVSLLDPNRRQEEKPVGRGSCSEEDHRQEARADHLAMARSVGTRLDPTLLGRLDLLLVAASVTGQVLHPVGVVRVRRGRWGPAVVLVWGQLGELDYELELVMAPVGGRGAGGAEVRVGWLR